MCVKVAFSGGSRRAGRDCGSQLVDIHWARQAGRQEADSGGRQQEAGRKPGRSTFNNPQDAPANRHPAASTEATATATASARTPQWKRDTGPAVFLLQTAH